MDAQIGDRVSCWKFVYDRDYSMTGRVTRIESYCGDVMAEVNDDQGHTDWFRVTDDLANKFEIISQTPQTVPALVVVETQPADESPYDFDTGLGIGGLARHDMQAEIGELIARGQLRVVERKRRGMQGQLWQECWCGTEPVCANCERCERHCTC